MSDFLITADASTTTGADFFHRCLGTKPRDRSAEIEYRNHVNAHSLAAIAESDAIKDAGPQAGETRLELLIRALAPLYDHTSWEREQAKAWARGVWEPMQKLGRAAA